MDDCSFSCDKEKVEPAFMKESEMNEAHIHLIINHLPIIGILISTGVLVFARIRRKSEFTRLGLWLVFITSLSTVPAYFSGEGAEELVEHLPGISENLIEEHEEYAEIALFVSQLTGLLALATILAARTSERFLRFGSMITLAAAAGSFTLMGLVANTGGKINHPELRNRGGIQQQMQGERQSDHEDDD